MVVRLLGKKDRSAVSVPLRLSYNTVDSYTGKIRVIFNETGYQDDWNRALLIGNPAADGMVKRYLKSVNDEQLQEGITSKQATPLFVNIFALLSHFLEERLLSPSLSPSDLLIVARDEVFFETLFFSDEMGGYRGAKLKPWRLLASRRIIVFYLTTFGPRL